MSAPQAQFGLSKLEICLRDTVAAAIRGGGRAAGLDAGLDAIDHHAPDHTDPAAARETFRTAYETARTHLNTGTIAFKLCESPPLTHDGPDIPTALEDDIVKLAYVTDPTPDSTATITCYPILETGPDAHHHCTCTQHRTQLWCPHSIAETMLRNQRAPVDEYYLDD